MELRTVNDLQNDILRNLWKLPDDIDLVVGIPRSGMLAASLVSLALNLPLADLESFSAGTSYRSGTTRSRRDGKSEGFKHALIVDDSSRTGSAMRAARQLLESAAAPPIYTTCVVYGASNLRHVVDICLETIDAPRIFEWNIMHHPGVLSDACLDIDGVLCHDPTRQDNDDGPRYLRFLGEARRMYIPSHPVGALVTSRLEKYRRQTEDWLRRHGVEYGELIMLDLPDARTRRDLGSHASFKASYYSRSRHSIFIESELWQAQEISSLAGKPVYCLEGPSMILAASLSPHALIQRVRNRRLLGAWARTLIGDHRVDYIKNVLLR